MSGARLVFTLEVEGLRGIVELGRTPASADWATELRAMLGAPRVEQLLANNPGIPFKIRCRPEREPRR